MNERVYISDVAKVAGVNKSTVSRVLNGKAAACRIPPVTQNRVRAAASQLGYVRNPNTRFPLAPAKPTATAPPPIPGETADLQIHERKIALVLATDSPATTLALIPGLEPILSAENYGLNIVTLPTDPTAAQVKVSRLARTSNGILCCPSIYPAVAAMTEKTRIPVIVLWQGAARAMLKTLGGEQNAVEGSGQSEAQNPDPAIGRQATGNPVIQTPPARPAPAPVPAPQHKPVQAQAPTVMPKPVIAATPIPVLPTTPPPPAQPPPELAPTPVLQETPALPPLTPEAPPSTPEPPITAEPTPVFTPEPMPIHEPAVIPAPVSTEAPTPVLSPEPPPQPLPEPDPTPVLQETPVLPTLTPEAPPPTPEPTMAEPQITEPVTTEKPEPSPSAAG